MSAIAMFMEGERAVRNGVLSERAQELDSVVSRYLPMFYKRAFRFLGNRPDAEDAVQDALLSAYQHLGQFRGQAQLSTWLTTIVTNAARMKLHADLAFSAQSMPVFGYGCAVFMQSDIVNFQRQGWRAEEILAGLAAVLPKNVFLYVASIPNLAALGTRFVLQGGTQNNMAVVESGSGFHS
jgi:hypothetical protein